MDLVFKLVATSGPLEGRAFEIDRPMIIGRQETDIVLDDQTVSRRHASVRPNGDTLEVEDLGSLNGTKVNDMPVQAPAHVATGATIEIGDTVFEVEPAVDPNATVVRQIDVTRAIAREEVGHDVPSTGEPRVGPTGTATPEPVVAPVQADQPVGVAKPAPEGPPRRIAKAYAYSGIRLVLGYGADFYAIWERDDLEHPVQVYPKTTDGWAEAWVAFTSAEPNAEAVPTS